MQQAVTGLWRFCVCRRDGVFIWENSSPLAEISGDAAMSRDQALSLVIINYFLVTSPVLTFDLPFTIISQSKLKYVFQMLVTSYFIYICVSYLKITASTCTIFPLHTKLQKHKTVHTNPLYTKGEIGARPMTAKG